MTAACSARSDLELVQFEEILAASPEPTRKSKSPASWPVPVQWHGGKSVVHLAPDAIFGLRMQLPDGHARRAYYFLEFDRGTMTIVPSESVRESDAFPYRATILRKLYAYADSFRQKLHETRFGIKAPRVVFLTQSEARARAMLQAATTHVLQPLRLPSQLFMFGVQSDADVLDMAYLSAGGETKLLPSTERPSTQQSL